MQWWQRFLRQDQPQQWQPPPPEHMDMPPVGPPPAAPPKGKFTPQQLYDMYRPWLEAGVPEFPGAPGQYKTFSLSQALPASTATVPANKVISMTSALYEISAAATASGTAAIGYLDAFLFQVLIGDSLALNSALTIGSAYFDRDTGVKRFKKPWIIPGGLPLNFNLQNVTGAGTPTVHINISVLELEVGAVQGV